MKYNFILVSMGTLIGRVLGYYRDIYIINRYGVTSKADTINFLLISSDFINNFFSWSIIIGTCLPILIKHNSKVLRKSILIYCLRISIAVYTIYIIYIYLNYGNFVLSISVISLTIFINIKYSFSLIDAQIEENFVFTSISNFIFNFGIILSLIISGENYILLSFSILSVTLIRYILSYSFNKINKIKPSYTDEIIEISLFNLFLIPIICQSFIGFSLALDQFHLLKYDNGSLTIYNLVLKIFLAPITIIIGSYLVSYYPKLIKQYNNNEKGSSVDIKNFLFRFIILTFSLNIMFFISLYLGSDLLKLFIKVETEVFEEIISILKFSSINFIPYSLLLLILNLCLANSNYKTLLYITISQIIIKLILYNIFNFNVYNVIFIGFICNIISLFIFYIFNKIPYEKKYENINI